jgi:hypothetical protein
MDEVLYSYSCFVCNDFKSIVFAANSFGVQVCDASKAL